jgi:thiamine-monophosphate kinase
MAPSAPKGDKEVKFPPRKWAQPWRYSRGAVPLPEKSLIAELRRMAASPGPRSGGGNRSLVKGIGDDCAVLRLPRGHELLVTTDFSLEGIHFRRDWHPPESVGHRCLTRGLSDIAAMGGEPLAAFLSLALPRDLPQTWVRQFARGLVRLAQQHGVILAGGDTAESLAAILADIVVVGSVPQGQAILRSGARPGDRIFVSGELGGSVAALRQMKRNQKAALPGYGRHFFPQPRVRLGRALREKKLVSAMIDTSDGLSSDLRHICEESGVGAEIDVERIPRARVAKPRREVDLEFGLHGGEDYELLFTVPEGKRIPARIAATKLTQIGRITRTRGMVVRDASGAARPLPPQGWEHFR